MTRSQQVLRIQKGEKSPNKGLKIYSYGEKFAWQRLYVDNKTSPRHNNGAYAGWPLWSDALRFGYLSFWCGARDPSCFRMKSRRREFWSAVSSVCRDDDKSLIPALVIAPSYLRFPRQVRATGLPSTTSSLLSGAERRVRDACERDGIRCGKMSLLQKLCRRR